MRQHENTKNIVLDGTINSFALVFNCILLVSMLLLSDSVFAFGGGGGGGHGLKSTMYKGGVDSIGVHINGKPEPIVIVCPERSEWDPETLTCVCEEGWVLDEDACVLDQCVDVKDDVCIATCDPLTGATTFSPKDTPCGDNMVCNGYGMCVCADGYEIWNGSCVLKCEPGYGRSAEGVCLPCPETVGEVTTESLCDACFPGSFWNNETCYSACTKVNYFHNKNGNCRTSCTDDTRVETTEKECYQSCGDQRKVVHYNERTYCAVLECPEEAGVPQFQDHIGTCYSCNTVVPQPVKEAKDCTDACGDLRKAYEYHEDDRHRINCSIASCEAGQYHTNKGACASCAVDNPNKASAEDCHQCNDGIYGRFVSADSICYSCTSSSQVVVNNAEECSVCNGLRYMDEDVCRLCPTDLSKLTDEVSCTSCGGKMMNEVCTRDCEGEVYCAMKDLGGTCTVEACCPLGGNVSHGVGINAADTCCYFRDGGYCSERDENGNCTATGCCYNSAVIFNTKIADQCADCYTATDVYCRARNSDGECTAASCCTGELIRELGLNGADVCCDQGWSFSCAEKDAGENCTLGLCCESGNVAYCSARDENGKCISVDCCMEGEVNKGTGENGADVCRVS